LTDIASILPSLLTAQGEETLTRLLQRKLAENFIKRYTPYAKQREFHAAGLKYRERLLRAGSQTGKTLAGAAEATYHATGLYPDWWQGRRISQPHEAWIGGPSGELVRDGTQTTLYGAYRRLGHGYDAEGTHPRHHPCERHARPDR
jgi:hypothetical protein